MNAKVEKVKKEKGEKEELKVEGGGGGSCGGKEEWARLLSLN